jgi:NAD(P)-dependent dehydrogenase (short-subunit alcohol dehydrogenase family)
MSQLGTTWDDTNELTLLFAGHYIPGATPDWPADKIETMMAEHCPLKRCATPDDVARVVAFLASEDGGWVNGKMRSFMTSF